MATNDLDRHLKGGWQTIAILAGGVAVLGAGNDGKIGLPIATAMAIGAAVWGAATVIDANYWSQRAIAFLSNVEAVYFTKADRTTFNPYIGQHPKPKLMDSLKYLFWFCIFFGACALANFLWMVLSRYSNLQEAFIPFCRQGAVHFLFYGVPFLVSAWSPYYLLRVIHRRLLDYIHFNQSSPGPGVVEDQASLRFVTFEALPEAQKPVMEQDTHAVLRSSLGKEKVFYEWWKCTSIVAATIATMLYVGIFFYKISQLGI